MRWIEWSVVATCCCSQQWELRSKGFVSAVAAHFQPYMKGGWSWNWPVPHGFLCDVATGRLHRENRLLDHASRGAELVDRLLGRTFGQREASSPWRVW